MKEIHNFLTKYGPRYFDVWIKLIISLSGETILRIECTQNLIDVNLVEEFDLSYSDAAWIAETLPYCGGWKDFAEKIVADYKKLLGDGHDNP